MVTMASPMDAANVQFENAAAPLVKSLTEAIADGDLNKARELAAELAKMKAKLDLIRVGNTKPEQIIIDVVVQRLGQERATIRLHVTTNWTFRHLQQLVEQDHGIPTQMQKWIVQRQFPRDDATLTSFGVKTGSVLGLYVMSARFARIKELPQEPDIHVIPADAEVDGFVRVPDSEVPLLRPVVNPRPVAPPPPDVVGLLGRDATNAVAPVAPEPVQWECTKCTYMNEATRPSCEMCLTDRPQNFVVPPDHQPSKVERDRMENEAMMTTLFQQTQEMEGAPRQYYIVENGRRIALGDEAHFVPNRPQGQFVRPGARDHRQTAPPNYAVPYWRGMNSIGAVAKPAAVKWFCTNCTYMNEATRPSCEMCATDRPQNFVVPPDYQPSKVERDRMEGEAMMTRLFHQTQEMEGAPRQYYIVKNGRQIALGDEAHFVPNDPRGQFFQQRLMAPPNFAVPYWRGMNNIGAAVKRAPVKWCCTNCTYMNEATRPSCEMCLTDRPQNFVVPPDYQPSKVERDRMEKEAMMTRLFQQNQRKEAADKQHYIAENLTQIVLGDEAHFIPNDEEFECPVCFTEVAPREGVVLRNCVHEFCIPCLEETIKHSEGADVKCPFADQEYQCDAPLQDREIAGIVNQADYDKYLTRSVRIAEGREKNSFHCLTPNCIGWCIYEDEVNFFPCPVCKARNCLTCKALHGNQTCQEYQDELRRKVINAEVKATMEGIQEMLRTGEAMNCPSCGVLLQKKAGCDWMSCSMCKTQLCWATRGPRWGPRGNGDTSGGCKCNVGGKKCHPNCQNCH